MSAEALSNAEIAALAQRVATARGKLPLQTDPALFDELSESEIAAERDLAEWIRAQRRRQRRRAVSAELAAEKRDRRVALALRRADDADARWHRRALAARRRVSNPDARLAQLYRRAEWSSRALIGVVVLGMVWAGVNVQHNLVPSGDMSDPLYWLSYGFEAMISIPIITIMVVATTAARWGREIARGKVVFLEAALLGVTIALNAGPHVAAGAPARAAEAAVAPVMVGVVIWLHAWVSARYAQLIDAIPDQSPATRTMSHRIVDAFAPVRDGAARESRGLAAAYEPSHNETLTHTSHYASAAAEDRHNPPAAKPSDLHRGVSHPAAQRNGHAHRAGHTNGNTYPSTASEKPGGTASRPATGPAHNGHGHPTGHTNGKTYPSTAPEEGDPTGLAQHLPPAHHGHSHDETASAAEQPTETNGRSTLEATDIAGYPLPPAPTGPDARRIGSTEPVAEDRSAHDDSSATSSAASTPAVAEHSGSAAAGEQHAALPEAPARQPADVADAVPPVSTDSNPEPAKNEPTASEGQKSRSPKAGARGTQLALDEPAPVDVTEYRRPYAVVEAEAEVAEEESARTVASAADLDAEVDNVGVWAVAREISERRLSKLPVEQLAEILALADESWTPAAIGASIGLPGSRILGILEAARRIRRPYAVSG
ncbi:hypothetical protein [Nocardia blacklockiae]|uniref:hypothetical protein n=1 Tax=Nocardia blacklockiae TaxID=480036 RepID=UPI00189467E7|nr:hypothetical protein [Nocardia blacklockiae]MBF6171481.1 hypothetical protein [Nocardia blacklockiae]